MPLKMRTGPGSLEAGPHRNPLDGVVGVALEVPARLERLTVAGGVGGARREHVLARRRTPLEAPGPPGRLAQRLLELGGREALASVGRDLHAHVLAVAGPGAALERDRAGLEHALARHELGHARWDHQR